MGLAPVDQGDVHLHKEVEAGEPAIAETGPGPFGPGDGDPCVPLRLGEPPPAGADRAEMPRDRGLSGAAEVVRDKGGVADLAVAIALPDYIPAFSRFCVGHFHNHDAGAASSRPAI